jgi:glycosyltransferase involved in cell wall biosynthesis
VQTFSVLQGFIDIAGQANRYARALQLLGYYAEAWAYDSPLNDESVDKKLNLSGSGVFNGRLRKLSYFLEAMLKFNIWHIHKGFSLLHQSKDLALAKRSGKSIVIHYRGREIRPEMKMHNLPLHIIDKVQRECSYADLVFVKDGQLAELLSPYIKDIEIFPNIVDVSMHTISRPEPEDYFDRSRKLRVIHIPSSSRYKGTELIRLQVNRIRDKVEYVELEGLTHKKLLEQYWRADVVIDQMLTGTYGNASLEAMALGRCVVNFLDPTFIKYEPTTPPIIGSEATQIAEVLSELYSNRDRMWTAGENGKSFIKSNHSYEVVGKKLHECYNRIR